MPHSILRLKEIILNFSHVINGIRRCNCRLLFCGQCDAKPNIILRVRGIDVPRYLVGLLHNRRHVSDESQVSNHAHSSDLFIRETSKRTISSDLQSFLKLIISATTEDKTRTQYNERHVYTPFNRIIS